MCAVRTEAPDVTDSPEARVPRGRSRKTAPRAALALCAALSSALAAAPARAEPARAAPAPPRTIALDEAVRAAIARSSELAASAAEVDASVAERSAARGSLGAKLHVDANLLRWDGPQTVAFALPGGPAAPAVQVRDPWTATITVSAVQPISALWPLLEHVRLRDSAVSAARLRRAIVAREVALATTETFYRLLQAESVAGIARASVEALAAQERRADSFVRQGVVARNDLLRAQAGLAAARHRLVQADGDVELLRARLSTLVGAEVSAQGTTTPAPLAAPSARDAEQLALAQRVELTALQHSTRQAHHGERIALAKLLPQVSLVGTYQHNRGSLFQQENVLYVGGLLAWDVFEWGAGKAAHDQARAQERQAAAGALRLRDALRLEARTAFVQQRTAAEAIEVAERGASAAEEAYRSEVSRYEARASTSTDVIQAQVDLAAAKGRLLAARYDLCVARAVLLRATGAALPGLDR